MKQTIAFLLLAVAVVAAAQAKDFHGYPHQAEWEVESGRITPLCRIAQAYALDKPDVYFCCWKESGNSSV